jgi:hypothetical protein
MRDLKTVCNRNSFLSKKTYRCADQHLWQIGIRNSIQDP